MLPMVQAEPLLFNCGGPSVDEAATASATLPPSLTPESDVDDFVDIFFDVDVGVNTIPRIESCDLQLGDTWRGMQGKMSVTAPVKKIRKKSDNKPQSQINKCHNEKKRRELENETINQLEELLGTCLAEVKQPDKNGIVREATRQIQEVLKRRRECPGECPLRATRCLSPVQAGEVSSTQPHHPQGLHYSELTTLIEALKHYTNSLGWVLLEINSKGEIECVTENIKDLILQERTELHKRSIFSLLHVNDHPKLRPLLRNIQTFGWGAGETDKFQAIQARILVKNPNGTESSGYVESVIHAAPVRGSSTEEAGAVMCVIRRCEDASALPPVDTAGGPPVPAITACHNDHIVFRLDCNFIVLSCDLSGVENYTINSPVSLVGARYLELVESSDRIRVATHLREATCLPAPPAVSEPFRLRISADKPWVRVSARSRLFRAKPTSGEPDFIMSTHTVLGDDDVDMLDPSASRPPLGGPLMTSVANGESSCETRYRSMSPADQQFTINDFDLDQWTSPFHIGEMSADEPAKECKEPVEEQEGRAPPAPIPAEPPPAPTPAPLEEPNRLRSLLSKKPPAGDASNSNNILKVLLKQEDEEATSSETSAPHTPLTPHTPHTPHTPAALSPLHSAQAQVQAHARPPPPPHGSHASHALHGSGPPHMQPSLHNNSDVLLKILNDKSDEDGEDRRNASDNRGGSQQSALLSQLLSNNNGPAGNGRSQEHGDSYLDRMAGGGMKRRLEDAKGAPSMKRATPENQQVTSSAVPVASSTPSSTATSPSTSTAGKSILCQKNRILVSLLARQQTPMPNPTLRAYGPTPRQRFPPPPPPQHQQLQHHPQHPSPSPSPRHHHTALSNILTTHNRVSNVNGGPGVVSTASNVECSTASMQSVQSHLQMVLQGGARSAYQPPPNAPSPLHYANTPPHHVYNNQPPSSNNRAQSGGSGADNEVPNDQALSDILDEVIDNMPEAERPAPEVSVLCDLEPSRQLHADYVGMKEKHAINAIRQSLMQCETVSKSPVPSSPGPSPVYSVQSPGACSIGSGGGPVYGLSSAGDAARARALVEQQRVEQQRIEQHQRAEQLQRVDQQRADQQRAEQQRARLLQMQQSQHMLVSPEAEQPQADLGSTINALVSATPPNVALTRTDYHHLYHQQSQMGPNYGTNKITSSQQNPMLSRQLSGSGAGGYTHSAAAAHSAAALHTPMTPQPYHRPPRPQLVGSYYEEGGASGGYCGDFARRPHAHAPHLPHAPHHDQPLPCAGNGGGVVVGGVSAVAGGGGGGGTSQYVRNELRAVVGARSRPELHPQMQPDLDPLITFDMSTPGGGSMVGRASTTAANSWESQQSTPNTTEAVSAEAAPAAAAGGDETRPAGAGAGTGSAAAKASLLQKLLSQ